MKKTQEQISFNMKQVKNKDSVIEIALRKELWNRGLRYQKNVTKIFGKPDLVFKGKKLRYSVIANFGTDIIGKNAKKILSHIKNFGYQKSKEICREILK